MHKNILTRTILTETKFNQIRQLLAIILSTRKHIIYSQTHHLLELLFSYLFSYFLTQDVFNTKNP